MHQQNNGRIVSFVLLLHNQSACISNYESHNKLINSSNYNLYIQCCCWRFRRRQQWLPNHQQQQWI